VNRILASWDRFFFQPQTAKVLGVYRIAIGLLTLYSFLLFAKDTTTFFSDQGLVTVATLDKVVNRDWHSLLYWIRYPMGVRLVLAGLLVSGACFTVGFYTQVSSILLFLLVVSFHERNGLVLNSGDAVLRTMLFFSCSHPRERPSRWIAYGVGGSRWLAPQEARSWSCPGPSG